MFNKHIKTFQYGDQTVTLETGEIARQAKSPVASSNAKANKAKKKS